jgi:hypothetical protein
MGNGIGNNSDSLSIVKTQWEHAADELKM